MVSSLSLAEFYSPFVFGSDIIPPRTASLTFHGELSVPATPAKLPQSTQGWLLSLDSWHPGPCLAYSRRSIDAGGTGHLGTLARCSRELCPTPCRGGCADPSRRPGDAGSGGRWHAAQGGACLTSSHGAGAPREAEEEMRHSWQGKRPGNRPYQTGSRVECWRPSFLGSGREETWPFSLAAPRCSGLSTGERGLHGLQEGVLANPLRRL